MQLWEAYKAQIDRVDALLHASDTVGANAVLRGELSQSFEAIDAAMRLDLESCSKGLYEATSTAEEIYRQLLTRVNLSGVGLVIILIGGSVIIISN